MGRVAIAYGATDVHSSELDRFGAGATDGEQETVGNSCLATSGTRTPLPRVEVGESQAALEKKVAKEEVILQDIWFQLSLRERECFGHRFSDMVLKAFGLRRVQEVQS